MELNTGSRQKMTPTWEAVVYWRATDWIRKAAPVQNRESTSQKDAEDQHPQAGDQLLIDPQLEGVHLRTGHRPLCDDEVDGVGQGAQDAQDVPQGGAQVVGQGEQGDASHRHDQHQSQLPGGPAAEEQEVQQGGKDHRQGTQKAGVGQAGVFDPEGGGGVYAKQGRSGGNGGLEGGGAGWRSRGRKHRPPTTKASRNRMALRLNTPTSVSARSVRR